MDIHNDLMTPREGEMGEKKVTQPAPTPNDSTPIFEMVIADIRRRAEQGRAKYGVALQAFNGRKALQDAYEEVLDLAHYVRQEMVEREALRQENDKLRLLLASSKADCAYCGLPAIEMAKCANGFPGCARADDMLFDGTPTRADLVAERDALAGLVTELRGALEQAIKSAHPHPVEHPTMTSAWAVMRASLALPLPAASANVAAERAVANAALALDDLDISKDKHGEELNRLLIARDEALAALRAAKGKP